MATILVQDHVRWASWLTGTPLHVDGEPQPDDNLAAGHAVAAHHDRELHLGVHLDDCGSQARL